MPIFRFFTLVGCLALLAGAAAAPRTLIIDNRTADVLRGIHVSPATSDHWGPDRATENIRIHGRLTMALPGPGCRWDIRIILGDRPAEQIFRNRNICADPVVIVDGMSGKFLRGREPAHWN